MASEATDQCEILIAEDNVWLRQSVAEILRTQRHVVHEVDDGAAALSYLQHTPIHVLILDLHMPKLDGLGLLRLIDAPRPAVIIYSAFEYFDQRRVEDEVGFKVFRILRKPVPPPDLISAVQDACPN